MKYPFLYIFFYLLVHTSFGQQQKEYSFSLEEAISFALDSSYVAINAQRDVAAAIKRKWETTATGLPQINANVNYQNNLKQPTTLLPAEIVGGQAGTFVPVTFGTKQSSNATATLSQLLFDGSYLVGLKAAKVFLNYSKNASEKTKIELKKGVVYAYGSVLLAQENMLVLKKNKKTLEKNLSETQEIYTNGLTEQENVEQLEITLSEIETLLNQTQRQLQIAKETLLMTLGIGIENKIILTETLDQLTQKDTSLSLLNATLNLEEYVDFNIAKNLTQQRDLEVKLEKSKALPSLSAFVNYGTQANSDDFSFFDNKQVWYQSSIFGVSMNVPIFSSGGRSAKTKQAKIALKQAKTQLLETKQKIKLDFNTSKSNYQFALENYENAKKNVALAERIEKKNQIKFKEGLSSSFDLRQAQMQLYSMQQNYLQAMLQVIISHTQLISFLNKN